MGIHIIDLSIFILYLVFMLGVGFYFMRHNKSNEDCFVGGRSMSAYFSAIMSTADSCLMAASGNLITDILAFFKLDSQSKTIRQSQYITLAIGVLAIGLATIMTSVLDLMLYSYAFMVSGLLVPVLGSLICKKPSPVAAMVAMIAGGLTTLILIISKVKLPLDLDANFFGISVSAIVFIILQYRSGKKDNTVLDKV